MSRFSNSELDPTDVLFNKKLLGSISEEKHEESKHEEIEVVLTTEEVQSLAKAADEYKLSLGKNRYGTFLKEKSAPMVFDFSKQKIMANNESELDA